MVRISRSRLNMEDGRIDRPIIKDYGETVVGGSAGTNAGSSYDVNIESGNVFNLILNSATCTFTFSNPSPPGTQCLITLYLTQDSTGGRNVTWPSSVKWPGDVQPTVTTTASARDVFNFTTIDGGSTWYGGKAVENAKVVVGALYELWAWGTGIMTSATRSSPAQVGTLNSWALVARGGYRAQHTLVGRSDGSLWVSGANSYGEHGRNDTTSLTSPVQIGTGLEWLRSAVGGGVSGAIKTDGTLWTWGNNDSGQLGSNSIALRSSPVQVGTLTNWSALSMSAYHSAAIKTDGTLWTWGTASTGRLGHNDQVRRSSPVQVGTLANWASVSVGSIHTAAVKTDGTLWTWGYASGGRLGTNAIYTNLSSPTQIGTGTDWTNVCAGETNTLAIKTDGSLWSWGRNYYGELGLNNVLHVSSPVQIGTLTDWGTVSVSRHVAAIKTDGTLWTWGWNSSGQIGSGTTTNRSSPSQIGINTNWVDVSVGTNSTIAIQIP